MNGVLRGQAFTFGPPRGQVRAIRICEIYSVNGLAHATEGHFARKHVPTAVTRSRRACAIGGYGNIATLGPKRHSYPSCVASPARPGHGGVTRQGRAGGLAGWLHFGQDQTPADIANLSQRSASTIIMSMCSCARSDRASGGRGEPVWGYTRARLSACATTWSAPRRQSLLEMRAGWRVGGRGWLGCGRQSIGARLSVKGGGGARGRRVRSAQCPHCSHTVVVQ